jgi:hypothetical protein
MRIDLQELSDAHQKYRRETEELRAEIDDLLPSSPPTPLFRPIGIDDSDLSMAAHEMVKEVFHSMAEIMEGEVKADIGLTKKSMVQYTLRALERPHFVVEQELKKLGKEGLEEGELEEELEVVFSLDLLRLD